jgi:hypothetical protein
VAPTLAWAIEDGVDLLVLRGLTPATLGFLGSRIPDGLSGYLPVVPTEVVDTAASIGMLQPMPGRYDVAGGEVTFTPRFPFLAGTSYAMILADPALSSAPEVLNIARPPVAGEPSAEVTAVYPSLAVLPRNALRFYIHFSKAMSEGLAARHVRLERAGTGEDILGAFSPMDFELWDPTRRRLTVLLDPARIKQGLAPHQEAGYPLDEGNAVVLVIDHGFRDAAGLPLTAEHRQSYAVGPDVRSRVDAGNWEFDVPKAGSRAPLVARFDRPLDRALLGDCLAVVGSTGIVPGTVEVAAGERSWSFVPDEPWSPCAARLLIDPVLEDIAGNSMVRVFDRELNRPDHEPVPAHPVSVPFVIAAS